MGNDLESFGGLRIKLNVDSPECKSASDIDPSNKYLFKTS